MGRREGALPGVKGSTVDEDGLLLRPSQGVTRRLFERYTLENGGISNAEELSQIITNLVVHLHISIPVEEIESKVGKASYHTPWTLSEFEEYFYREFNFSSKDVHGKENALHHDDLDDMDGLADIENRLPSRNEVAQIIGTSKVQQLIGEDMPVFINPRGVEDPKGGLDVMAFGSVENYCYETSPFIEIPVVRRGTGKGEISASWKLENVNVLAISYKDQAGTVTFSDGEKGAVIKVMIYDNDQWNLEATQLVHLFDPVNCTLGELKTTTIYILNEDEFPNGETDIDSPFKLTVAFFQHLYLDLTEDTKWAAVLKVYPALSWLIQQFTMYVALKIALPSEDAGAKTVLLLILAGISLLVVAGWHYTMDAFENIRLGGKSRMILRRALVSTMIQLTNSASEDYPSGECLSIMSEAVENATSECWVGIIKIWATLCQLFVITGMSIWSTLRVPYMIPLPFVMGAIDLFILKMRMNKQSDLFAIYEEADNAWKSNVIELVDMREVVTTYRAGFKMETAFAALNKVSNSTRFQASKYQNNTEKILKWVHTVFIVVFFVLAGLLLTVPEFVVIIGTVYKFDSEISKLFGLLFGTVTGFVSVKKLAILLNANTRRKALLGGKQRRVKIMQRIETEQPEFEFDPGTIVCYQLEYDYASDAQKDDQLAQEEAQEEGMMVMGHVGPISLIFEQGQIFCIQSGSSAGKKTLLKLLARFLLPTKGIIWYPDNLRVRYLNDQPVLFSADLMTNLKFGNQKPHTDEEIWAVCKHLKLSSGLIGKGNASVGNRGLKLSVSDRIIIGMARALLSSVDLLLISNSFDMLGILESQYILSVLKQWIDERGLFLLSGDNPPGVAVNLKKKKTVFYVTKNKELESDADSTINLRSILEASNGSDNVATLTPGSPMRR